MSVRDTSLEVFKRIKDNGLLSQRRLEVYAGLFEYGPCTANELFKKMRGVSQVSQANIQPRLNELVSSGVAKEVETRDCSITGNRVIVYDVTSGLPIKFDKSPKRICRHCAGKGYTMDQQAKFDI